MKHHRASPPFDVVSHHTSIIFFSTLHQRLGIFFLASSRASEYLELAVLQLVNIFLVISLLWVLFFVDTALSYTKR